MKAALQKIVDHAFELGRRTGRTEVVDQLALAAELARSRKPSR